MIIKIKLNEEEWRYINSLENDWQRIIGNKLNNTSEYKKSYMVSISEDEACDIRDYFIERLQCRGFDADYQLTKEGRVLEDLIDKFFF